MKRNFHSAVQHGPFPQRRRSPGEGSSDVEMTGVTRPPNARSFT